MIFLTEYDERKHLRYTYEEGREEGREGMLLEQIEKKRAKGKSVEKIAEELEADIEIIDALLKKYQGR